MMNADAFSVQTSLRAQTSSPSVRSMVRSFMAGAPFKLSVIHCSLMVLWMVGGDWLFSRCSADIREIGSPWTGIAFVLATGAIIYRWMASYVKQRDRAEEALRHLALHDPLTGLLNRYAVLDRLNHAIARCGRKSTQVSILYIDLDGFKEVNDRFGHESGDLVLRVMAKRMREFLRECDSAARLGGDEFLVLLEGDAMEGARRVVERLKKLIEEQVALADAEVSLSASIGIAVYPDDAKETEALIRLADFAMYEAKTREKNRLSVTTGVGLFDPDRLPGQIPANAAE